MRSQSTVPTHDIVNLFIDGSMQDCRLTPEGSNYTFYATLADCHSNECRVVYKPRRGEAPLWDFADGTLYMREYATYLLSEALGWGLVPYTTVRDGTYGIGSVQLYIESDPGAHYFTMRDEYRDALLQICAFDVIANNADRKASHCLLGSDDRVWAIDHGVTFHSEPKLRTVIWEFAGLRIPDSVMEDIEFIARDYDLSGGLREILSPFLDFSEVEALWSRIQAMINHPVYPFPSSRRSVPWPWI